MNEGSGFSKEYYSGGLADTFLARQRRRHTRALQQDVWGVTPSEAAATDGLTSTTAFPTDSGSSLNPIPDNDTLITPHEPALS